MVSVSSFHGTFNYFCLVILWLQKSWCLLFKLLATVATYIYSNRKKVFGAALYVVEFMLATASNLKKHLPTFAEYTRFHSEQSLPVDTDNSHGSREFHNDVYQPPATTYNQFGNTHFPSWPVEQSPTSLKACVLRT